MAASKIYGVQESGLVWATSGSGFGGSVMTLTSLANNAGRIGPHVDRGAGSLAPWLKWRMQMKSGSAFAVGNTIQLYIITTDGGTGDGALSTSDAALSAIDKLRNLRGCGAIVTDSTTIGETQIASGFVLCPERYFAPVLWNASGQTLTSTPSDHYITFYPFAFEGQ